MSFPAKPAIQAENVCVKSYPWPTGTGPVEQHSLPGANEMKAIRELNEGLLDGKRKPATAGERALWRDLKNGAKDREQIRLYGDLLYVQSLVGEKRYAEAAAEVERLKGARKLKTSPAKLDPNTYYSRQELANLILLRGLFAQSKLTASDFGSSAALLADFAEQNWGNLASYASQPGAGLEKDLLRRLVTLNQIDSSWPHWHLAKQLDALPKSVAGIDQRGDATVIYIKGRNLHAVEISPSSTRLLDERESLETFHAGIRDVLDRKSTPAMRLFAVTSTDGKVAVEFPGGTVVMLRAIDVEALKKGTPLASEHPLTRVINGVVSGAALVMYSHPLMQRNDAVDADSADKLLFALQRSYPGSRIYRDPLSPDTAARVAKLSKFDTSPSKEAVAVIADKSFDVSDWNLIQNIEDDLKAYGIAVMHYSGGTLHWTVSDNKALIVITGHQSPELASFIASLGAAGAFKGNIVLFNSCQSPLTRQLSAEITGRYGAVATTWYEDLIRASQVKPLMRDLASFFNAQINAKPSPSFLDFLRTRMRTQGLNGTWVVSEVERDRQVRGV